MGTIICSVNYFCFGAVLIFVGSVLLCALGFTIVLPYEATIDWPQTTCQVINSSYHHHLCSCDRQPTFDLDEFDTCVGKYPCLQIYVRYKVVKRNASETMAPVPNETTSQSSIEEPVTHLLRRDRRTLASSREDNETNGVSEVTTVSFESVTDLTKELSSTQVGKEQTTNSGSSGPGNEIEDDGNILDSDLSSEQTADLLLEKDAVTKSTSFINSKNRFITVLYEDTTAHTDYEKDRWASNQLGEISEVNLYDGYSAITPKNDIDPQAESDTYNTGILFRAWTDAFYKQCTLHECRDEQWNRQETSRYRLGWGLRGQSFLCFHHPVDTSKVILEKTPREHMIHALVWPSVCLFIGSMLWLGLCFGCWTLESDSDEKFKHKYGQLK